MGHGIEIITITGGGIKYIASYYRRDDGLVCLTHTRNFGMVRIFSSLHEARKAANAIATRGGAKREDYIKRVRVFEIFK